MKLKTILTFIILPLASLCYGQADDSCSRKKILSIRQIKKLFPYNQAVSVKLVSFKYDPPVITEDGRAEDLKIDAHIPKTNGWVDLTKMFEVRTLENPLKNILLNILVNYEEQRPYETVAYCYEPRNGIVFMDKNDQPLAYLEICFSCLRYEYGPAEMRFGTFCVEKFAAVKNVFKQAGIRYGTDEP